MPIDFALGLLCVIDDEPRTLDTVQEKILRILAKVASDEIRLRAMIAHVGQAVAAAQTDW